MRKKIRKIMHSKMAFFILWLFFSIRMITDRNDPNPLLIDIPTTPMSMETVMWFIGFYALFLLVFMLILNTSFSKQHPKTAYFVLSLWVLLWMFIGMLIGMHAYGTVAVFVSGIMLVFVLHFIVYPIVYSSE